MAETQIDVKRNEANVPAQQGERRPAQQGERRPAGRDPFQDLRREMSRMFDRVWGTGFGSPMLRRMFAPETFEPAEGGFEFSRPAIDFSEDDKAYHLAAELPGLSEKDIDLTLSDDVLTISGEKHEEKEDNKQDYHFSERRFGSFRRSVRLPQHIDRDKIEASFKNGVLNVSLPKTAEAMQRQKKIEIKTGQ